MIGEKVVETQKCTLL